MYCLDTSIVIGIFRGDRVLLERIRAVSPADVSFTVITLCELFKGAYKAANKEQALQLIADFSNSYRLCAMTPASCATFGKDFNAMASKGRQTQELDLMIASIAKENGLVLVTRNRKHFEHVPDLRIEAW